MKDQMVVGVDIDGINLRVGSIKGNQTQKIQSIKLTSDQTKEYILEEVANGIARVLTSETVGIGVGVPSIVNVDQGIVYEVTRIPSWKEVRLKSFLEDRFNIPVYVNNDANCFTTGVKYFGEGLEYENVVGLIIGEGMGAGIILNGKLQSGSNCGTGEFGKLTFREHDYEYYCSSKFFKNEFGLTFDELLGKAEKNDHQALKIFEKYGYYLGTAIKAIIYSIDPDIIIMGGPVSNAYPYFSESMNLQMQSFAFKRTIARLKIGIDSRQDMTLLGAAALYYDAQQNKNMQELIADREKAEHALKRSEEKYFQLFNNISDPIFITDNKSGKFINCNETVVKKFYGYSLQKLRTMSPADLHPEEERKRISASGWLKSGRQNEINTHIDRKGKRIEVDIHSSLIEYDGRKATLSIIRDITEQQRAQRDANRRAVQSALISDIGQRLSSELDLDVLLEEVVKLICDSFGYYGVMLFMLDEKKRTLNLRSIAGGYAEIFRSNLVVKISEGMIGNAVRTRSMQISGDVSKDPNYINKSGESTKSELAVPIISGKKVIGVLDLQSDQLDAFDETDAEAAITLSTQIASAIENARLYKIAQIELEEREKAEQEAQHRAAQSALIYEVGQRVSSALELDVLLSEVVHAVRDAFDYYGVMLLMVDEKHRNLILRSIAGGYAGIFPSDLTIKMGEGMIGTAAKNKTVRLSGDVEKDPNYVKKAKEVTRSELSVPIISGKKVIGVLDFQSDRVDAFNESDVASAWTLSSQIANAIENARLYEQAQQELKERQQAEKALRKSKDNLQQAKRETDNILKNVEEGLFILDKDLRIGSQHSRALLNILNEKDPALKNILEILSGKVSPKVMESVEQYLEFMFDPGIDEQSINDLNPMSEMEVRFSEYDLPKFLSFKFRRIVSRKKIIGLIATVIDVSRQIELTRKLEESRAESKRQMDWLMNILHVEPQLLKEFIDSVHIEMGYIDRLLKNNEGTGSYKTLLEKVFRSMHLIKGNASMLDLSVFVERAHQFEEKISALRDKDRINGSDFVPLVLQLGQIRKTVNELSNLIERISKIHSHFRPKRSYESELFIRSLQNLVTNLSNDLNKHVQLKTDKFDAANIPYHYRLTTREILIQMIRNSVYHGLENADEREQLGKSATGVIEIQTESQNGFFSFSIYDDGRGIQIHKLREKARKIGKWKDAEIDGWTDEEVAQLIFLTGVSTLDTANLVAGRGVGMDLVRDRIQQIGGTIELEFEPERFCLFHIKLPLKPKNNKKEIYSDAALEMADNN